VGRYDKPEQYENIILKANPEGEILRMKDIAKVSLGSSFYDLYSDLDGKPAAAIVLKQTPSSNATEVIKKVKEKLDEIKESFPPGTDYEISYDVSSFLDASVEKVLHTLLEAFVLVSLVVFLFLGDFRSTLIPVLAVPVSLIGALFFMLLFGLSINLIALFALVLAIGVLVEDAIVVVEAVHEKMHTKHIGPYQATQEVMHEISGAIVTITMTMTAVFVPVTFMTGPVGVFYRQFGLTVAMAIVLSGVVALTLTPVLCAMILKPHTMNKPSIVVGSTWEQGFARFGQFYKFYLQTAPEFRRLPDDLENMFVRNDKGDMVPYSAFLKIKKKQGLNEISRYNLYTTAAFQGAPAAGFSTGQAIEAIQQVAAETLPRDFDIDWQTLKLLRPCTTS